MYAFTYLEVNISCILIILIILNLHLKNLDKSLSARIFSALLFSIIIYFIFDLACGLMENDVLHESQLISTLLNIGFFFSSYLVAYFSFVYSECEIGSKWMFKKDKLAISFVPVLVMFILTILTLKYRFFFYIDDAGNYIKGPLYFLMLLMAYSFLIAICTKCLSLYFNKKYFLKRDILLTMSSFVVFPLLAGLIQAFHTGVSIVCLGGTIAIVQVFTKMQNKRITIDTLTQINNRTKLMQYLDNKVSNYHKFSTADIYFVMIDIDRFKAVNDTYGHIEGDEAIIALANILKLSCNKYSCMLARYGGDEFSIVYEGDITNMKALVANIEYNLKEYNAKANKPYDLQISLGYAKYDESMGSIPELISKADDELYKEKRRKNKNRRF